MTLTRHAASHFDHALTEPQIAHAIAHFADRAAFFAETLELPPELGEVPCALYGPILGDRPIGEDEVTYVKRGDRAWKSRMVAYPVRFVRTLVVIAGPHDGHDCIVYTMFGGPLSPREPGDVRREMEELECKRGPLMCSGDETAKAARDAIYAKIVALREDRARSDAFWREHALAHLVAS